jgi:sulfate/thiosulfate transport system substrate-binding protein
MPHEPDQRSGERVKRIRIPVLLGAVAVLAALVLVACGGSTNGGGSSGNGNGGQVNLVAYSTPQEAYQQIIPAFQKTPAGKGVSFKQSYGASGDQERAVEAGLPADVVALSLAPDVNKLVKAELVAPSWNADRYHGFVTNSVVVFTVRKGNPKGIRTWDDLLKPGVQVVTPNPFTSGGARWNTIAAYGAQLAEGKTDGQAVAYLNQLFAKHVVAQDKSARESLQTFLGGKGDVALTYENEAITAQQKGEKVDYVIPKQTILIQNPTAVMSDSHNAKAAKAFRDYLWTPAAQKVFVTKGYRSVLPSLQDKQRFPVPAGLFTIDKLGGWTKVNDRFFDPQKGVLVAVEQSKGVATEKS